MREILVSTILLCSFFLRAQTASPVKWSTAVEKISKTEYILIAKSTIEPRWNIYSQAVPQNISLATIFTFDDSQGDFIIVGNTAEEEGKRSDDNPKKYFDNKTAFRQKNEIKQDVKKIIAFVEYSASKTGKPLPAAGTGRL